MVKIKDLDVRPSRANPEARAARKKFEKENPHISMSEVAIKGGALALLTAVALFPWEKEYEKHERNHHPERFEDDKKGRENKDDRRSRRDADDRGGDSRDGRDRRRRRQSEGGEREREYRMFLDRDREYRPLPLGMVEAAPSNAGGGEERYTGDEDGEYGRRYNEASRKERERRDRRDGGDEHRRRGSVDYEYRRSSRDERRR